MILEINYCQCLIAAISVPLFCLTVNAQALDTSGTQAQSRFMEKCLLQSVETAHPDTTIGKLRADCEQSLVTSTNGETHDLPINSMTPVQKRILDDQINFSRDFVISTFRPNYFIGTYSNPNEKPFDSTVVGDGNLDNFEAKFQISVMAPLWRNMLGTTNDLIGTYTSTSWWQLKSTSGAFRETNYQPEVFLRHYGGPVIIGGEVAGVDLGLAHQSNGRGRLLSRSWNRVMGRIYLDFDNIAVGLRAWYRIPEDASDDENPNMHRYYGYGDVSVVFAPNKNTFTAMYRPGTKENGQELTWSYPIANALRIYAQYWNGYGESLLDYDVRIERVGIGIALNDWLQRR